MFEKGKLEKQFDALGIDEQIELEKFWMGLTKGDKKNIEFNEGRKVFLMNNKKEVLGTE